MTFSVQPRPHRPARTRVTTSTAALAAAGLSPPPGLASCAGTQRPADQIKSPGEALFNGRGKPDVNCYSCHNGDGTGTIRGPNLGKRVPKLTDQQIAQAIADGPGLMPSFKDKVTDAEVKEITA